MSTEHDPSAETLIRDGRQHYTSKRYKRALENFTRAMKRCPCTRKMKRERCVCKDYEKVASLNGCIFSEAMYQCKCDVGRTFNKCDNLLHIQALDYRAATFEAMNELERARKDAEWILELAPRLPDGYLRLGKIARLQKKHEFAWKVYNAGIDANANASNDAKQLPKVKQLYAARQPLHARFFRQDPLQLPLDLVQIIFLQLDLPSLVRCAAVCKRWRRSLTSRENIYLWRTLRFPKVPGQRAPSVGALANLISYSGNDVRHFAVLDAARFRLSQLKFQTLLAGSKRLEHLEIHGHHQDLNATTAPSLPCLTRLVLVDCQMPRALSAHVADSLESIHVSIPRLSWSIHGLTDGPPLPKMKYLRLEHPESCDVILDGLVRRMPNLEQLCVIRVTPSGLGPDVGLGRDGIGWKNLKALIVLGTDLTHGTHLPSLACLTSMNQGNTLRHLQFSSLNTFEDFVGLTWLDPWYKGPDRQIDFEPYTLDPVSRVPNTFKNLQALRLKNFVLHAGASQHILKHSLSENKLESLDIVFYQPSLGESEGVASCRRLQQFEWARGSSSIRSIGVSNFRFTRYPRTEAEFPLPAFLASFPNLETLEINSEHYEDEEFCSVITEAIKATNLKTVYQSTVKGFNLDKLRKSAKSVGVDLIWGERPLVWPIPILDS